jgi:hypothetical protein
VVDITEARRAAGAASHPAQCLTTAARAFVASPAQVPDFNTMYELYDPCSLMFFFRNKVRALKHGGSGLPPPSWLRSHALHLHSRCHAPGWESADGCGPGSHAHAQHIMIDLGTGNNNKINWAFSEKQELIDIIEVVYRCVICIVIRVREVNRC